MVLLIFFVLIYQVDTIHTNGAFSLQVLPALLLKVSFLFSYTYISLHKQEHMFVLHCIILFLPCQVFRKTFPETLKMCLFTVECFRNSLTCIYYITFLFPCQHIFHHFHHFILTVDI